MPKKDDSQAAPRKFLFDVNKFDDESEAEPEIIVEEPPPPPPPPTFSEAELAQAKEQAFAQGKIAGLAEAQASREQFVAGIVDTISRNFALLFAAEEERAARYETEAVLLADAIFKKLFRTLNERHGLAEIRTVMERVLESQRGQPRILVEVHPDYVEDIENALKNTLIGPHGTGACAVAGAADLGAGDCRMLWEGGGAQRDAGRLAAAIEKELEQVLADRAGLHDNRENNEDTPPAPSDGDHTAQGEPV